MGNRQRGVVLTECGKEKLEVEIAAAQEAEKYGKRFTQAELSERANLSIKTIKKIRARLQPTDEGSVRALFKAFGLELQTADYGLPELQGKESQKLTEPQHLPHLDLIEAPDAYIFYGREAELLLLSKWIVQDKCRLIVLIGMGGIGKTALSVKLGESVQSEFDYYIWRSLREAPPIESILTDLIKFLSDQQETDIPETAGKSITRLIHYLHTSRCLLILDNAESILERDNQSGKYLEGYEEYGTLFQRIGESRHQSCLVVTSREKPREVSRLEGFHRPIRSYRLLGLEEFAGQEFLKAEGLDGTDSQWKNVFNYYSGNPLALKIAANTIQDLFAGDIANFLLHGSGVFGDIRDLLEQQFERLTDMGKSVMYWLTINRGSTSIKELKQDILNAISTQELLETLESLRRRSLVDQSSEGFTLQNVVMEYLTNQFSSKILQEILTQRICLLNSHALIKATAKDYVRETQIRLILKPIRKALIKNNDFEELLKGALSISKESFLCGYVGGNILNLLVSERCKLSDFDFSNSTIWQAYLQGVELHNINFTNSDLSNTKFTKSFKRVTAIALHPDGNVLAVAHSGGEIQLLELFSGRQIAVLNGYTDWVISIAFSPDGCLLASGDCSSTIKLWDINGYKCLCTIQEHQWNVSSVIFHPNSQLLASASYDGTVKLWELGTYECLETFNSNVQDIWAIDFSSDGKTLAISGLESIIELWAIDQKKCVRALEGNSHGSSFVKFTSDGEKLISSCLDKTTRLWDVRTGRCLKVIDKETAIALSQDHYFLVTCQDNINDSIVRIWDLNRNKCVVSFEDPGTNINAIFNPECNLLITTNEFCLIQIREVKTGNVLTSIQGYENYVSSISFSDFSDFIACGYANGKIKIWKTPKYIPHQAIQAHKALVRNLVFNPNREKLISFGFDKSIKFWSTDTWKCLKSLPLTAKPYGCYSLNQKIYAHDGGSLEEPGISTIEVWNLFEGQHLRTLKMELGGVWDMSLSSDGDRLAIGVKNRVINIFDLKSGNCLFQLDGHKDTIFDIAFSIDNKILASSSWDKTIRLWDLETGICLNILRGHTGKVYSLAFHPNGKTVASCGDDETVRIWKISTGECLTKLKCKGGVIRKICFSPNGNFLAVYLPVPGILNLWNLISQEIVIALDSRSSQFSFSPNSLFFASSSTDGSVEIWDLQSLSLQQRLPLPRLYEGVNITGTKGLTEAQRSSLLTLGAVDRSSENSLRLES
ncbi:NB-ARC domain-containing protein [Leptothoe sp. ISB3NOV94-8A]